MIFVDKYLLEVTLEPLFLIFLELPESLTVEATDTISNAPPFPESIKLFVNRLSSISSTFTIFDERKL